MTAELQAALSRSNLAREPWSQALLLLLETVDQQSSQIRRLEEIIAADVCTTDINRPGVQHTPASLAVSFAHQLQGTKQQVAQLQDSCAVLSKQQEYGTNLTKETSVQFQQLQQRMQHLEQQQDIVQQQIGINSRPKGLRNHPPAAAPSGTSLPAVADLSHAATGLQQSAVALLPAAVSVATRLQQLEQQMSTLSESAAGIQECTQAAASAVRVLDEKISRQLSNIRTDTKQAITVATAVASKSLKAEIQSDIASKARESERQLKLEMQGLSRQLESSHSSAHAAIVSTCRADMNTHLDAARQEHQQQLQVLQKQLEKVSEDKADMRLLTQYTQQVNDVFEQLSATLVDSTQTSIADLDTKQQQLTTNIQYLSASKADCTALLQLQQQCQQQVEELHCALAAAQQAADEARAVASAAKRAADPVAGYGLDLADTQGAVSALQSVMAGLASSSNSHSTQLQDHSKLLQRLGTNHHMLQQQLVALTNQIDPAAAAVLAAAAAGNDDATAIHKQTFQSLDCDCLCTEGDLDGAGEAVYEAKGRAAPGTSKSKSLQSKDSGTLLPSPECKGQQPPGNSMQHQHQQLPSSTVRHGILGTGRAKDASMIGIGVMRHLPVTMRLCLLETCLQEVSTTLASKALSGDLEALTAQVDRLSSHLTSLKEDFKGVNSSRIKKLEEQTKTFVTIASSLTAAIDDRPTNVQVHSMVQELSSDANRSIAAAEAAGQAAVAPLQHLMQDASVELEATKRQLAEVQDDLSRLQDWQASRDDHHQLLQKHIQQLEQQMKEEQRSLQRQLESSSRKAATQAVGQLMVTKVATEDTASQQLSQQVSTIDTKLKILTGEIDRLEEQATAAAHVQDQHNNVLSALETALTSHISQCTAADSCQHQQQQGPHQGLAAALHKCQEAHDNRLVALESAAKGQAIAVSEIAGMVAAIPSKEGIKEAVIDGATATAEALLQESKQEQEQRWEVWLSEFARALEQRPTFAQLKQQIVELQLRLTQAATEMATGLVRPTVAQEVAVALDDGVGEQLKLLDMRLDALEEALSSGLGFSGGPAGGDAVLAYAAVDAATGVTAAAASLEYTAGEAIQRPENEGRVDIGRQTLEQEISDLREEILKKLSLCATQGQVQELLQQRLEEHQWVGRQELDGLLQKKLDIEAFLASVAARTRAVLS